MRFTYVQEWIAHNKFELVMKSNDIKYILGPVKHSPEEIDTYLRLGLLFQLENSNAGEEEIFNHLVQIKKL